MTYKIEFNDIFVLVNPPDDGSAGTRIGYYTITLDVPELKELVPYLLQWKEYKTVLVYNSLNGLQDFSQRSLNLVGRLNIVIERGDFF